jgi:hypothetical protein
MAHVKDLWERAVAFHYRALERETGIPWQPAHAESATDDSRTSGLPIVLFENAAGARAAYAWHENDTGAIRFRSIDWPTARVLERARTAAKRLRALRRDDSPISTDVRALLKVGLSLREVGGMLDLSYERVRQIAAA